MQKEVKERINLFTDDMLDWSEEKRIDFVKRLLSVCDYGYEKYAVIMLYIYGMRPEELMRITKDKFKIEGEEVRVKLPTVKKGQTRVIDLSIKHTPFMPFLIDYVNRTNSLLPRSWNHTTNINGVFKKISKRLEDERISPYIFRKFRLSFLAIECDASGLDLQTWKGAKDMRSVDPYLRMRPVKKFSKMIR